MPNSAAQSHANQSAPNRYCDRCARRSTTLEYDDLTLQALCIDCCDQLRRRRATMGAPLKPIR